MSGSQLCNSLMIWLETFPNRSGVTGSQMSDGVIMAQILHQIAPEYFSELWLTKIKPDIGDNWRLKVSNLRKLQQGIIDYYQEQLGQNIKHFPLPDLNQIAEHDEPDHLGRLLQLILGCAVRCERKQHHIEAIMNMEESVQAVIMVAIQEIETREGSPARESSSSELGSDPASFHPQLKTVLEQLETTTQDRDQAVKRCHALEQQVSLLTEERNVLDSQHERVLCRLEALEGIGGDGGGVSTLRYKDLKKQIDTLQDDLYKIETSREEYRVRVAVLERENQETQARNEELQELAEEARSLKDEVDALTEMREKVSVYEVNMEAYKKKLEELSDLKRQLKSLEDKNADYMQHTLELEEEVKKSDAWRPQLELYKKQVADMHQKLSEEAKKTDRQVFENKKFVEKMEAVTQEKERVAVERDALRETIEEMKCQMSTLTSPDNSLRPPSDLSDADMLETIPHEIREKLMRLQHENKMLKQHSEASESVDRLPVLQAMVSDLQERHNQSTQENRWGKTRKSSLPALTILPQQTLKSYFDSTYKLDFDSNRKLKMFKRNLKWFSESDLLILRQPKGFLSSNFLSSSPLTPSSPLIPHKALTLPSNSQRKTNDSNEKPIVIRHIHEFKMSQSPTNEDSGCCRTSPSSCEGCEDHGRLEVHSPDYSGTLDSGISGVYRCLTPVIPSIVEECTAHHVSDILPALSDVSPSPVYHHVHPSHKSCAHCCSPKNTQVDKIEDSDRNSKDPSSVFPLSHRAHSVCSYNTPYNYSISTSPLPTSPNLLDSPPQSPSTKRNVVSGSLFSLPTTSSEHLYSSPPPQSLSDSCFQTTANGNTALKLTSLNFSSQSASDSQSCSSPQGGRSSGFSRSSHTPESPTPHNSPRLPNSIHATRTRSNKSSSSLGQKDCLPASVAQKTFLNKSKNQDSNFEEESSKNNESNSFSSRINKTNRFSESGDSSPCRSSRSGDERQSTEERISYVQKHLNTISKPSDTKRSSLSSKDSDGIASDFETNSRRNSKEGLKTRSISVPRQRNTEYGNQVKIQAPPKQDRNRSVPRSLLRPPINKANQETTPKRIITKPTDLDSINISKPFTDISKRNNTSIKATILSSKSYNQSITEPKNPINDSIKPNQEKAAHGNSNYTTANESDSDKKLNLLTTIHNNSQSSSTFPHRPPLPIKSESLSQSSNIKIFSQSDKSGNNGKQSLVWDNFSNSNVKSLSSLQAYHNSRTNISNVNSNVTIPAQPINRIPLVKDNAPNASTTNSTDEVDKIQTLLPQISNTKTSTVRLISSSKGKLTNYNDQNPSKSCLNFVGSYKQDQNRNVKFREPVVSQVTTTNSDVESVSSRSSKSSKYSPSSPRERISPLPSDSKAPESIQVNYENNSSTAQALMSVDKNLGISKINSKLVQSKPRETCFSTTDTETDHDTLERRMTLGMYAAPLVSSESCTSISHDEQDGDPSATDYCTENASEYEDYNPKQFKVFSNQERAIVKKNVELEKGSEDEKLNEKYKKKMENVDDSENEDESESKEDIEENDEELTENSEASNLVDTYKFFRKQNKMKSTKNETKIAATGGIIKKKKKAKKVVSETINAMFTLCTP